MYEEERRVYERDEFFRVHPLARVDWRWEWRGNTCGAWMGTVWTPYGVEYCSHALGARYYWFGNECRSYTTLGVFLVAVDTGYCGYDDNRLHFAWYGTQCWEYDYWNNPVVAIDMGFCTAMYGTHYDWVNGACAQIANVSNAFIAYTTVIGADGLTYQNPAPCEVSSLITKKSDLDGAVALLEDNSSKVVPDSALGQAQGAGSNHLGLGQTSLQ
jgi:hypothetical protein